MIPSHLLFAAAFALSRFGPPGDSPGSPGRAFALAAALPVLMLALGVFVAAGLRSRLFESREDLPAALASAGRQIFLLRIAALSLFLLLAHGAKFASAIRGTPAGIPFVQDALLLVPYFLAAAAVEFSARLVTGGPAGVGIAGAAAREVRALLVAFAALACMGGLLSLSACAQSQASKTVWIAAAAAYGFGLAFLFPLMLRAMWRLAPLHDERISEDLRDLGARAGFSLSGVFLWDACGSGTVNAAVSGLLKRPRYLLVTPDLLSRLGREEVRMVLAHEAGHVSGRHGIYMLCCAASFIFVSLWILEGSGLAGPALWASMAAAACFFGAFMAAASRAFEKEADLFAASLAGDRTAYMRALDKVAAMNGGARAAGSATHSSMESRMRFLDRALSDLSDRRRFEAFLAAVKAAAVLMAVAGAVSAAAFFLSIEGAEPDSAARAAAAGPFPRAIAGGIDA